MKAKQCKHEWSYSYRINKAGTLTSVLECDKCSLRIDERKEKNKETINI